MYTLQATVATLTLGVQVLVQHTLACLDPKSSSATREERGSERK